MSAAQKPTEDASLDEGLKRPEPLEFFNLDYIHPDNQAMIDQEQRRWRLLSFWERINLRRYVGTLRKRLRQAHYNPLQQELADLWRAYQPLRDAYKTTAFISDAAKREQAFELVKLQRRAKAIQAELQELRPVYEQFVHYQGWLDYEAEHRRELKEEAAREKRIKRDMAKEAKHLEKLLIGVWKQADGCHYTTNGENGKLITKAPRFERSIILPDAHYFYVAASKKVLFGWKWLIPHGVMISDLYREEVLVNMRTATKRQVDAIWTVSNQLIIRVSRLDSPDAMPRLVKWRDAMKYFPDGDTRKMPYTIGVTESRKFRWFDFASIPHILVGGSSQSGKSNLVNGIIATLASTHTPSELRLVLVDQKGGIEFTHWEDLPHLLWEMVKTVDEVYPALTRLIHYMKQRMSLLQEAKAKDIDSYNAKVDEEYRLERILLVIDELSTFVGLKGGLTDDLHNAIMVLTSQGRAVGIHVIAATQYPEVKVLPGRIKSNMTLRLSGSMPSVISSLVILDTPEAARLPAVPGRFAVRIGLINLVVQVPFISDDDIAGVVLSARNKFTDVANDPRGAARAPQIVVWDEQRVLKWALRYKDGKLSGRELHKLLGQESPGERHLMKVCRSLVDQCNALGVLRLEEDGAEYRIKRVGKANVLVRAKGNGDDNDKNNMRVSDDSLSPSPSPSTELVEELEFVAPVFESASD